MCKIKARLFFMAPRQIKKYDLKEVEAGLFPLQKRGHASSGGDRAREPLLRALMSGFKRHFRWKIKDESLKSN